jgi:NAD(P)-dependent dehydrogenase (short-subunit alcohol dehydrogenase family)
MIQKKRLVMITGATRGLGLLVAEKFWNAGHDLVILSRSEPDLERVSSDFHGRCGKGQKIHPYLFDLKNSSRIPDLMEEIRDSVGALDIVINNAAVQGPIGPLQTNDWEEWQTCLDVCLLAPVKICQEVIPGMILNNYGRIVNMSGGGATGPRPNFSSYATAKCGLVRFSETLAQELSPHNITVNCVSPGAMNSELTRKILNAGIDSAGQKEYEVARRLGEDNPHTEIKAADLVFSLTTEPFSEINGRLLSAVWDPLDKIPGISSNLMGTDVYTLRRIVPKDRHLEM